MSGHNLVMYSRKKGGKLTNGRKLLQDGRKPLLNGRKHIKMVENRYKLVGTASYLVENPLNLNPNRYNSLSEKLTQIFHRCSMVLSLLTMESK